MPVDAKHAGSVLLDLMRALRNDGFAERIVNSESEAEAVAAFTEATDAVRAEVTIRHYFDFAGLTAECFGAPDQPPRRRPGEDPDDLFEDCD